MSWEVVIGLETHAQLATRSKIFSGASTAFGAAPNTQASAVDLALPGVLPVLNREAVTCAIKFGLAVGATIAPVSIFARKNYFYPDLPKGYQISQYELPVVVGGGLTIRLGEHEKFIRLTRAHLEEDAGKSVHDATFEQAADVSGIDLNRAGTPLLEIVSEPDLRSSAEAVAYARTLHALVVWLGICDGNMQEGSFRCDANVSVRKKGDEKLGTRCEIKNVNSFRFLERAIEYEIRRQIELIEDGGKVVQETRLYDPDRDETRSMRSKEDAMDYRYFPDPDLLPLAISETWIANIREGMPELPDQLVERLTAHPSQVGNWATQQALLDERLDDLIDRWADEIAFGDMVYGLPLSDARQLVASRELSRYFEHAVFASGGIQNAKTVANWILGDLSAALNRSEMAIQICPVSPRKLGGLIKRIADGTLSGKMAKEVFEAMWNGEGEADAIIEKRGLKQVSDAGAIEAIVDQVLAANPKSVEEFRAGKEKAFNALVGQVMKASQGKANPAQVNEVLKRKLAV